MARYCCFENSIDNAYTAIMERVFFHATSEGYARPIVPTREVVTSRLKCFLDEFVRHIRFVVPVDFRNYPEMNYRGRKLVIYKRARDNIIGRTAPRRFASLKTFIKHEKILEKNKRLVPRVIQPRSPEYNVCVGRYIRQLEHRVYEIIDKLWCGPTVMKGLNSAQQGAALATAWQSFSSPVAVMLDAVRFDQHVSAPMLQWEHETYLRFFPMVYRQELAALLSMQLLNQGVVRCGDGVVKYVVEGCRASGDMNTAMGNVLIMCAALYSFVESIGVKGRLLNNGDDCCLIVERRDLTKVKSQLNGFFSELGFIIDVEGVTDILEKISFCQTSPVFDGRRWCMVRDVRTAISKDSTVLKNWSEKEYSAYLHELGVAGLSAYSNMPVWSSFYRCLSRSPRTNSDRLRRHVSMQIEESGLGRLSLGMSTDSVITDAARTSFAMAFGLLPATQRYLEEYYDQMSPGGRKLFALPAVSRLF